MAIISVENLNYSYNRGRDVLKNISFKVEPGESLGIVGDNGSGKTTLCYCLCGIIPHVYQGELQGAVRIRDMDIRKTLLYHLATEVGIVLQNPNDQIMMPTVEDEIAFSLENHLLHKAEMVKRVTETLELVGITDLRDESPNRLSGGEKQLVALATVLALQPSILIFDEPLSMLDEGASKRVLSVMCKVKEQRKTLVIVDHTLKAAHLFDKTIKLAEGRIQ